MPEPSSTAPPLPALHQLVAQGAAFALLDDARAAADHPASRLLHGWQQRLHCADPSGLAHWQQAVAGALAAGRHVLLLADYDWGLPLHGLAAPAGHAGLRAEVFAHAALLDADQVNAWLADPALPPQAGLLGWHPAHDRERFCAAVAQIQAAIARGQTYQVNHTFALHGRAHGEPAAIYRQLRQRQPAGYGALVHLPGQPWVLSLSPELFLRVEAGLATAEPMKGTVAAGQDPEAAAQWLRSDAKNRAENLMIVDLLRNDLARVAQPGSVQVPSLFDIVPVGRVLGMTSTVQAQLRTDTDLAALLAAVFPCGSITGAPKRSTMALIQQLETAPPQPHHRGLYTGAIGWLAGGTSAADMQLCLSVPIRTLELSPDGEGGHYARLPVGAGITIDSDPAAEWDECLLKGRFARHGMAGLSLLETLRVEADGSTPHWPAHRARLQASAAALGLPLDSDALEAAMARQLASLPAGQPWRLRLALDGDGRLHWQPAALPPLPGHGPVRLLLADAPVATPHWLLAHKTDRRDDYTAALARAGAAGAFDVLFFNARGELTEGARSNVFVQLDGHWYTPPVACGLLPGVMRAVLLADPALAARERILGREDLAHADALMVCNALRGALPAVLAG